ncbi:MAG: hypothetical protein CMH57_03020 [Myxococcales bacterium]|nr:hypothetical protein [Myxococcales bacterium]
MRIRRHLKADLSEHPDDPKRLEAAIALRRREVALARARFAEAPEDHTARGILARELNTLGDLLTLASALDEAEALLRETLTHWGDLGRTRAHALTSLKLATALRLQGRPDEALALLAEQLLRIDDNPNELEVYTPFMTIERGVALHQSGEHEAAQRDLQDALRHFRGRNATRQVQHIEQLLVFMGA